MAGLHEAVESLPIFSDFTHPGFSTLCGVGPVIPRNLVQRLLGRAAEVGPKTAVNELRAFLELKSGTTRATMWVRNVTTTGPIDLGYGVRALPMSALSDPEFAQSIVSHSAET